jgi:protein gp37
MGNTTGIEWTDATWNPIRGCSRVSEGCRNCYAERVAYRFSGAGQPYEGLAQLVNGHAAWTGKVDLVEKHLLDPLKWGHVPHHQDTGIKTRGKCECPGRSRRIFVNSMSDLFHPNVPDEWIDRIFAVMALCPQHTFQILTKRPERMLEYLSGLLRGRISFHMATMISRRWHKFPKMPDGFWWSSDESRVLVSGGVGENWPLPNVQLGVSVEDQKTADERIPLLLQTPAAVRFISAEPLLGAVDLEQYVEAAFCIDASQREFTVPALGWVICGGESGPGARPMHPDWARGLRDQCVAAGVPFFFKQWGEWIPWQPDGGFSEWKSQAGKLMDRHAFPDFKDPRVRDWTDGCFYDGADMCVHQRVGKKAAGSLLDGREWKEFPR